MYRASITCQNCFFIQYISLNVYIVHFTNNFHNTVRRKPWFEGPQEKRLTAHPLCWSVVPRSTLYPVLNNYSPIKSAEFHIYFLWCQFSIFHSYFLKILEPIFNCEMTLLNNRSPILYGIWNIYAVIFHVCTTENIFADLSLLLWFICEIGTII